MENGVLGHDGRDIGERRDALDGPQHVDLAEGSRARVPDEPRAVGDAPGIAAVVEPVVVEDDGGAVARRLDVNFDAVRAPDGGRDRRDRVLRRDAREPPVGDFVHRQPPLTGGNIASSSPGSTAVSRPSPAVWTFSPFTRTFT